jgi:hypothetical protein
LREWVYSVAVDHRMDIYNLRPLSGMLKMLAPSTPDTSYFDAGV